jgi:hypothetical protein
VARKLTESELSEFTFEAQSQYPWDEWLDGSHWVLDAASDFPSVKYIKNFRKVAADAAAARGLKLRSKRLGPDTIVIQAFKNEEERG